MQRRSLASQSLDGVDSCFIIRALLGLALIVLGFVRSYRTSALNKPLPEIYASIPLFIRPRGCVRFSGGNGSSERRGSSVNRPLERGTNPPYVPFFKSEVLPPRPWRVSISSGHRRSRRKMDGLRSFVSCTISVKQISAGQLANRRLRQQPSHKARVTSKRAGGCGHCFFSLVTLE